MTRVGDYKEHKGKENNDNVIILFESIERKHEPVGIV